MIYLDNAATSFPKPINVVKYVNSTIQYFGGNPGRSGHDMSIKSSKIVYSMRQNIADFFGLDEPERVILTKNCTESLNIAIMSIMKNGGNAIISSYEHNSVLRPLEYLKENKVCNYKVAKASFDNPNVVLYEFERLIDSETKMIICTHASNVTGQIAPIDKIAELCKRRKIIFCLDASQTAGIININMNIQNIDILCCPGHKALMGIRGTGLLLSKNTLHLSPIAFGGTGSSSLSLNQPDFYPDMLESGTLNVAGAASIDAGVDFINRNNINNIYNHEIMLAKQFYNGIKNNKNVLLYSNFPENNKSVATISFNLKGKFSSDVADILNKNKIAVRGGLHCAPLTHSFLGTKDMGTVRASFSYFNTINEIRHACTVINNIN